MDTGNKGSPTLLREHAAETNGFVDMVKVCCSLMVQEEGC